MVSNKLLGGLNRFYGIPTSPSCSWRHDTSLVSLLPVAFRGVRGMSSEFVSSSFPSWQTLTAHAQQFRRARDLVFCLKVPLDSLLVWASSEGSGETARMRRLAWTFAARIGDKYQIRLMRSILSFESKTYQTTFIISLTVICCIQELKNKKR